MTPAELAAAIKAKYPSYAGMDDGELVAKITAKYPQYKAQLTPETPAAPPEKSAMDWVMGGPEAQLSGVDKGVYQAFKGAATFPFEVAKQQVQAAVQGDPSALIPGGPVAKAEAERVVGEGAGAIQSAKQGDILAALHQALSAIPGIGGMYKDAATDVIQGNPDVGAGKVLGNVMAARVTPDVVPPAATAAGRGIKAIAKAAQSPLAKRFATNVAVPGAAGAVGTAVGGPGIGAAATYLTREWIKDNAVAAATKATEAKSAAAQAAEAVSKTTDLVERAAATKRAESFKAISDAWEAAAERVKAEEARIEAMQAAADKAAQADSIKAAQLEVKTLESADTAVGKQIADAERTVATGKAQGQKIDLKHISRAVRANKAAAANRLKDTKAQESASFQSAKTETQLLEASQKAQAAAPENPVLTQIEGPQVVKGIETPKVPAAPAAEIIKGIETVEDPIRIRKANKAMARMVEYASEKGKPQYGLKDLVEGIRKSKNHEGVSEATLVKLAQGLRERMTRARRSMTSLVKDGTSLKEAAATGDLDLDMPSEFNIKVVRDAGRELKASGRLTPQQAADLAEIEKMSNIRKTGESWYLPKKD